MRGRLSLFLVSCLLTFAVAVDSSAFQAGFVGRMGPHVGGSSGWGASFVQGDMPGSITFVRASQAGYFNSSCLWSIAQINEPRFDHRWNSTTNLCEPRGLLIEAQRTNLLLWNRDLTNAAWTKTNMTVANTATGIDGVGSSATRLTATSNNGTVLQSVTSGSAARATTAYVRRVSGTGTVEMTQNGGTNWTAVTVTSQWTRVGPASATITNPSVGFRLATSGDAIEVDFVQLENGTFASSAIGTAGSAATRASDFASIEGSSFATLFPNIGTEGAVVLEIESAVPSGGTPAFMMVFSIVNTANVNSNRFVLEHTIGGNGIWRAASNGSATINGLGSGALQQNVVTKRGFSFKDSYYVAVADGAVVGTQLFGAMPVGLNAMGIGLYASVGNQWFGWFRNLTVLPVSPPVTEMQMLTQ